MKYARLFLIGLLVASVTILFAGPVSAGVVRYGQFQVELINWESVQSDASQNTGYNSTWYGYPQNEPGGPQLTATAVPPPTWWNQWWYNDPFVEPGGKWVRIKFHWSPVQLPPGTVYGYDVTINWTNSGWQVGANGGPPIWNDPTRPPYNPETYIERYRPWTFEGEILPPGDYVLDERVWLPINYNPEWVSVDVRGANVNIWGGEIWHQCVVPEPLSLLLLGAGLVGLAKIRRRFR